MAFPALSSHFLLFLLFSSPFLFPTLTGPWDLRKKILTSLFLNPQWFITTAGEQYVFIMFLAIKRWENQGLGREKADRADGRECSNDISKSGKAELLPLSACGWWVCSGAWGSGRRVWGLSSYYCASHCVKCLTCFIFSLYNLECWALKPVFKDQKTEAQQSWEVPEPPIC